MRPARDGSQQEHQDDFVIHDAAVIVVYHFLSLSR